MNIAIQKNNILHRILDVQNLQVLNNIEKLLDNEVYTYTTSGKALSINDYKNHLNQVIILSDAGAKGFTTAEAKAKIKRK